MTRPVLGGLGVVVGLYGAWLLLSRQDGAQVVDVVRWLVAGVVLHDVVLAGLVLVAAVVVTRVVPEPARAPVAVAAIVLGSVTLLAVPVLGRFGAKADNPTLLDRDYLAGWSGLALLVVVVAAAASVVRMRRAQRARGESPRR
jgi:hypothetical protein